MTNILNFSFEQIRPRLGIWIPLLIGFSALFGPTIYDLSVGLWSTTEQGHGPIVLGVSCWLAYRNWPAMQAASDRSSFSMIGWFFLVFGLLCYVLGRSQSIIQSEFGAILPILIGLILIFHGKNGLKKMWFPLFFLLFTIPLPGVLVQALTLPLKTGVSIVAEHILYSLGYPVARSGVIINIGQYQLLVADACAGLHSLFTLEAVGLLYLNVMGHDSLRRNLTLAIFVFPISFVANVIRVIILILITYYLGDAAGQGFLHGFAGMVLFSTALILIFSLDTLLGKLIFNKMEGTPNEK